MCIFFGCRLFTVAPSAAVRDGINYKKVKRSENVSLPRLAFSNNSLLLTYGN